VLFLQVPFTFLSVITQSLIKGTKDKWIDYTLRRKDLLKHVIEGKVEGTGRWRRRPKQLLFDLKGTRK